MTLCKKGMNDLPSLKGKKVIVRVDYNVPIKDGKILNDLRIRATIPTIKTIIDQGGKCILISHMGRPAGVSLQVGTSYRKGCKNTWTNEKGTGKTAFFADLLQEDKVKILQNLDKSIELPKEWDGKIPETQGSGKVAFFAQLSEQIKTDLLNDYRKAESSEQKFHFLRDYCGYSEEKTLKPVHEKLSELLEKKVVFGADCLNAKEEINSMQDGDVILLENVRFYKEENSKNEEERLKMAKILAGYADYYVCDAFGTAHREAATITGIPKILGNGVAGYLMKKEIDSFAKALTNPSRPMCAIVGGAKVSDKIKVLENLVTKVDYLLVGGAMAYAFLRAKGTPIGNSFCEKGQSFSDAYGVQHDSVQDMALSLYDKLKDSKTQMLLPVDHVCHTEVADTKEPLITEDVSIPDGYMALDIGPKTREKYAEIVSKCATIVWNGPMGVFELPAFSNGTNCMVKAMAENSGLNIIGGGDSASAAEKSGLSEKITHISTGGGAALELLEGKQLPGVAALENM